MKKKESHLISISLKSIKYSGNNIGRNFKFSISIGRTRTEFSKTIANGKTVRMDKVLYLAELSKKKMYVSIQVGITEKDPVTSDKGHCSGVVNVISREKDKNQRLIAFVKGCGRTEKTKVGKLEFKIEAKVDSGIRYISDANPNGWLVVRLPNGKSHPLPYQLKVKIIERKRGREYFKILEGRLIGRKASVKLRPSGKSYLTECCEHLAAAELNYNSKEKILKVKGRGEYKAEVDDLNLIPVGRYEIELPYEPHSGGNEYQHVTRYAKIWFRINYGKDRFLHVGRRSIGCVTVKEQRKWTKLCRYLLNCRASSKSIGFINIK